jgi:hypothetical protein
MPFLTDDDYKDQIKDSVLNTVIESTASYRTNAEAKAIEQAKSRLRGSFNVETIFSQTGANRNAELVMYLVDMVLYHLHSRINPGQVPSVRAERYQDALEWLKNVGDGTWSADFPGLGDEDENGVDDGNVVQAGSSTPRDPYF